MRQDYVPYQRELEAELVRRGFNYSTEQNDELCAVYLLSSNWKLILECERYYAPQFTIWLSPPSGQKNEEKYALWLVMKVFESKRGRRYGAPTIARQVEFLADEEQLIFGGLSYFRDEYERLNAAC